MNINKWFEDFLAAEKKAALPILSFPAAGMLDASVDDLIHNADIQTKGILEICKKYNVGAAQGYMNLSVEAEAFGAEAVYAENEIPTIVGQLISEPDEAEALEIPEMGTGQTATVLEGLKAARTEITDKPFFAECIGPYSLAGRLMNVNEIMINCYEEPEMVHTILEKATSFIKEYIYEFKKIGMDGVIMAEPLTGVLSPSLAQEFSHPYVKEIINELQDESFAVIYHNCGNETPRMLEDLYAMGAKAYHFGDHVDMADILARTPETIVAMGNISPAGCFISGNPDSIYKATKELLEKCGSYKNFWISSGCDVPPQTDPANIDAFFRAVDDYYGN